VSVTPTLLFCTSDRVDCSCLRYAKLECSMTVPRASIQRSQVCKMNGGIYIKAAQFASRLASVPLAYRDALGALGESCSVLPAETIRMMIERETRQPLDCVFASLSDTPVAAASLAQVCLLSNVCHTLPALLGRKTIIHVDCNSEPFFCILKAWLVDNLLTRCRRCARVNRRGTLVVEFS
jgi:hypothetical protein